MNKLQQELSNLNIGGFNEDCLKSNLIQLDEVRKLTTMNRKKKSAEICIKVMNKATLTLATSSTFEILKLYNEALAYAPNDSVESSRVYANRSAILFNNRLYEDSIKDIDRALALGYPDQLKAKLYTRKARNLFALGPEYRLEADQAIADARYWIEKMNNDDDKKLQEIQLEKLIKRESFEEPMKKRDNSCIVPDIVEPNEQLIGSSKAIKLEYSEKYGRHFVATRYIKPGEILIKVPAYASVLPGRLNYANCWNCSKQAWTNVPCRNCVNVIFCDENCRNEAWDNFHDIECIIFTIINRDLLDDVEILGIKMTIKALKEAGSIASLMKNLQTISSIAGPIARAFTDDKLDGSKYASMYTLVSTLPEAHVFSNRFMRTCAQVLHIWIHETTIFKENNYKNKKLFNNKMVLFMGSLLVKNFHISRINSSEANYYQLYQPTLEDDGLGYGVLIACLTSYVNSSCDPNAQMVHSGNTIGIRCIHSIKKNEQLFICYGTPYHQLSTIERRNIYKSHFNFFCECRACNENWGPYSVWPSFKTHPVSPSAAENIKKPLTELHKIFQKEAGGDKTEQILMSTDPQYIPPVSEYLDTLFKNLDYPFEEICSYKEIIRHNFLYNSY